MHTLQLGVLFGGRSGEHEVSLVSAASILAALDRAKYAIVPIGITKDGAWLTGERVLDHLRGTVIDPTVAECVLSPDPSRRELLAIGRDGLVNGMQLDVVFPVLHGTFGEDGTIQGLLDVAGIPYVGAGVMASAIGMDKVFQKRLFAQAQLPVVASLDFDAAAYSEKPHDLLKSAEEKLGYPVFVKPPNLGSSVGISKARNREELAEAVGTALRFDRTVLIEHAVPAAREIEVGVLGNSDPVASVPGEVIPSNEFYDYDAKYVDGASETRVPAEIDPSVAESVRALAVQAFRAIGCEGLARVDFLLSRESGKLFLNEINTMPGFTSISMYPKMFEASGIPYPELLDRLIALALERQEERESLVRSYVPKSRWFVEEKK